MDDVIYQQNTRMTFDEKVAWAESIYHKIQELKALERARDAMGDYGKATLGYQIRGMELQIGRLLSGLEETQ